MEAFATARDPRPEIDARVNAVGDPRSGEASARRRGLGHAATAMGQPKRLSKTGIAPVADDDVVEELDTQQLAGCD